MIIMQTISFKPLYFLGFCGQSLFLKYSFKSLMQEKTNETTKENGVLHRLPHNLPDESINDLTLTLLSKATYS